MKKIYTILFILPLLMFFFISSAQSQIPNPFFSIGPEFGWNIQGYTKIGFGGSLKFGLPITQRSTITLTSGFSTFLGKTYQFQGTEGRNLTTTILPIRIGWRYNFNKGIYVEPQVGYSRIMLEKIETRPPGFGALHYGLNIGVIKGKHWDISAQWFTNKNRSAFNFHSVGTRIAYNFNLKK